MFRNTVLSILAMALVVLALQALPAAAAAQAGQAHHHAACCCEQHEQAGSQAQAAQGDFSARQVAAASVTECTRCDGSGYCSVCGGKGVNDSGNDCSICSGSGLCYYCNGTGQVR